VALKWEYTVTELLYEPCSSELLKQLNIHGEEGWELVSADIRKGQTHPDTINLYLQATEGLNSASSGCGRPQKPVYSGPASAGLESSSNPGVKLLSESRVPR
jgi:hypothetical protein